MITVILSAAAGAVISSLLACIPGLHIYNVLGLLVIGLHAMGLYGLTLPTEILVPVFTGMIVGYAMLNTVPAVLLAAPDESAFFTVQPGQKYLMRGRGYEAVMITAIGGLAGLFLVVFLTAAAGPRILYMARSVFRPHTHWILWCVICFMLMSEWPKAITAEWAGWFRFLKAWKSLSAGLLTFLLSGILGFVLFFRSPVSSAVAFQNLMPAFVGLFTIPSLIMNIVSRVEMPRQNMGAPEITCGPVLSGVFAGGLGGGFAAFFPVITGGVGGFLAGHATAVRDDRSFLVSQGTSKLIYYVGGFLFFFMPGLHMIRGGGAQMLGGIYAPQTYYDFYMAVASIAVAGAISFLLIGPLARGAILVMKKSGCRQISFSALIVIILIVFSVTGLMGLFVMLVGAGIGLIPLLFGARRMNCLGVILLPMACNMSGIGAKVAGWLGLG
ncbi:tripartite tricarboxylate transporter permease [Verrucomicrobiota bacterium]